MFVMQSVLALVLVALGLTVVSLFAILIRFVWAEFNEDNQNENRVH